MLKFSTNEGRIFKHWVQDTALNLPGFFVEAIPCGCLFFGSGDDVT